MNNAAVFRDAWIDAVPAREITGLIMANVSLAVTGCATAIRRFLAAGAGGSIVNVSSHQAQRAVRGALPYATAKAAVEGLTRALAVGYGPRGIRVNAVALGSIATERNQAFLARQQPAAAARVREQMRALHPLGRVGHPGEVAAAVGYLLSEDAPSSTALSCPWTAGGRSSALIPSKHDHAWPESAPQLIAPDQAKRGDRRAGCRFTRSRGLPACLPSGARDGYLRSGWTSVVTERDLA